MSESPLPLRTIIRTILIKCSTGVKAEMFCAHTGMLWTAVNNPYQNKNQYQEKQ